MVTERGKMLAGEMYDPMDPELVAQWWGRGNKLVIEKFEMERGGHWRFVEHTAEHGSHGFEGRIRDIQPKELISQTFEWDGMPGYVIIETVTLEDLEGAIDVLLFPSSYRLAAPYLTEDAIITVRGRLSRSKDTPEIMGQEVTLPDLSDGPNGPVVISLPSTRGTPPGVEQLKDLWMFQRARPPLEQRTHLLTVEEMTTRKIEGREGLLEVSLRCEAHFIELDQQQLETKLIGLRRAIAHEGIAHHPHRHALAADVHAGFVEAG